MRNICSSRCSLGGRLRRTYNLRSVLLLAVERHMRMRNQLKMQKENQRWIQILLVDGYNLQTEGRIKKHEVKLHLNHTLLWKQIPSGNFPFSKTNIRCYFLACVLKRMCMYMCVCVCVSLCVFDSLMSSVNPGKESYLIQVHRVVSEVHGAFVKMFPLVAFPSSCRQVDVPLLLSWL